MDTVGAGDQSAWNTPPFQVTQKGTRTLLQEGYTGDYAIVLEPTDLRIGPASRGVS